MNLGYFPFPLFPFFPVTSKIFIKYIRIWILLVMLKVDFVFFQKYTRLIQMKSCAPQGTLLNGTRVYCNDPPPNTLTHDHHQMQTLPIHTHASICIRSAFAISFCTWLYVTFMDHDKICRESPRSRVWGLISLENRPAESDRALDACKIPKVRGWQK